MNQRSELFAETMGLIYPLILLFGLYILYNGHLTPGGGFQGGAIIAGVFTIQYLSTKKKFINLQILTYIEKIIYLLLIITGICFVLYLKLPLTYSQKTFYLIWMNLLIGIKVSCGITVIFFRFILFESR